MFIAKLIHCGYDCPNAIVHFFDHLCLGWNVCSLIQMRWSNSNSCPTIDGYTALNCFHQYLQMKAVLFDRQLRTCMWRHVWHLIFTDIICFEMAIMIRICCKQFSTVFDRGKNKISLIIFRFQVFHICIFIRTLFSIISIKMNRSEYNDEIRTTKVKKVMLWLRLLIWMKYNVQTYTSDQ